MVVLKWRIFKTRKSKSIYVCQQRWFGHWSLCGEPITCHENCVNLRRCRQSFLNLLVTITKPLYNHQTFNSLKLSQKPPRTTTSTVYIALLNGNNKKKARALKIDLGFCLPSIHLVLDLITLFVLFFHYYFIKSLARSVLETFTMDCQPSILAYILILIFTLVLAISSKIDSGIGRKRTLKFEFRKLW